MDIIVFGRKGMQAKKTMPYRHCCEQPVYIYQTKYCDEIILLALHLGELTAEQIITATRRGRRNIPAKSVS